MIQPSLTLAQAAGATWDVVVIGGGVAGALAARELARRGLAVLLVDKAAFPRWKVCGCCLNPAAQATLASVGLGDLLSHARPLAALRLGMRRRHADLPLAGWLVLSRERLDAALVAAALRAGAAFLPETVAALGPVDHEHRQVHLRRQDIKVQATARLVLAADGLGNRLVHDESTQDPSARVGAGVVVAHGTDYEPGVIHMACGPAGYVGAVRLEDGRLNLAAALDVAALRQTKQPGAVAERLLEQAGWPAIPNLAGQPWRGTPAMSRQRRHPAGQRLLIVGDAAGYLEPFTGEGMSWAMTAGVAAATLARRALDWLPRHADEWTSRQRHAAQTQQRLCRSLTWISHHPVLAEMVIRIVGRFPALAAPLLPRSSSALE